MNRVSEVLRSLQLTAEDAARRCQLPQARVQAILEGAEPNLAELRALSQGLRVPLNSFGEQDLASQSQGKLGLLFRSAWRTSPEEYEPTVERVARYVDAALKILPPRNVAPDWVPQGKVSDETYAGAQRLAAEFRERLVPARADEPIPDLPQLLAGREGVVLGRLEQSRYEGASLFVEGYCFVFVSTRFAARMLFTLAHEVGHLIFGGKDGHTAVFERTSEIGTWSRSHSRAERFVDAFASIFLLPDRGVGRALKKVREVYGIRASQIGDIEILVLSRIFGVSFEVAARRCEDLELLPRGGAVSLTQQLRKDYGSPERRANELGLPPRVPVVFPKLSPNLLAAATTKINAGEISIGWLGDQFGLSPSEIYALNAELSGGSELRR
jgi:Zn-dependent peptidase ImmA (M78 family)